MVWTGDGHNGEGNGTMTNKYATKCGTCGGRVDAGAGTLVRSALLIKGWMVICNNTHMTLAEIDATEAVVSARTQWTNACAAYDEALIAWRGTLENSDATVSHAINSNIVSRALKLKKQSWTKLENLRWGR